MLTVGLDLGGTKWFCAALDGDRRVVGGHRAGTPVGSDAAIEVMATVASVLQQQAGEWIGAIGVGVPGLVDRNGVLRFAPNLPGVLELDLPARMAERIPGTRWRFDNDATCAGWGEKVQGAAK